MRRTNKTEDSVDVGEVKERNTMADPAKYKSLSVNKADWEQLGVLATKTNRTRSKMIGRLIRFFLDNKGGKANGKNKSS